MHDQRLKNNLTLLAEAIARFGIKEIEVVFSGSGDNGQIDCIEVFDTEFSDMDITRHDDPNQYWAERDAVLNRHRIDTMQPCQYHTEGYRQVVRGKIEQVKAGVATGTLDDLIQEVVYQLADNHDWVNDDGGCGEFHYRESEGIQFEQHRNITKTERVEDVHASSFAHLLAEIDCDIEEAP